MVLKKIHQHVLIVKAKVLLQADQTLVRLRHIVRHVLAQRRKPDSVSYSMVQVQEEPGVSMSNQGAENVTGSEDPHSKNDKHQIPYPYPSDDVDQVNTNVKKYQKPTWDIAPGDRVPNGEVDEENNAMAWPEQHPEDGLEGGGMGGAPSGVGVTTYAGSPKSQKN